MTIDRSRLPSSALNTAMMILLSVTSTLLVDTIVLSIYLVFQAKQILRWICSEFSYRSLYKTTP